MSKVWYQGILKATVSWVLEDLTLDSGISVAPVITVALPLKNLHIMILILFYTNLGIAIIFEKSKINKRTPTFIPESRVLSFCQNERI